MKKGCRNLIYSISLLVLSCSASSAQFKEASIGINGLTCSQCSRSVEMRIRKLPFIKDVKMNLEHTEGHLYFKDNQKVDINKIASAVEDAGFSVRYLKAVLHVDEASIQNNRCMDFSGDHYAFVNTQQRVLKGDISVTFLGNQFQEKKELKKWTSYLKTKCNEKGVTYFVAL